MVKQRRQLEGVQHHWKAAGAYSTLGLEITLSVTAGLIIGQWLDKKFHAGGGLTALWFCFGVIAGGRALYRALKRANREAERELQDDQEAHKKYLDDQHPR